MTRLRVLHCIYDDPYNPWLGGGGAHRVFEIYRRLTDRVDATVVAGAYPEAVDRDREGVRYEYLGARRPYGLSRLTYGRQATSRLRRGDYDAAVFDFSVYTPIRVPPSRPVGHVVHMLMGPTARDRWGRWSGALVERRERRMLASARLVAATSDWLAARLRPLIPPSASTRIVRTGVPDEFFAVDRRESNHLLYYGRFDLFQKGLDVLLDAAPDILAARPGLRLVVAGRGKDAGGVSRRAGASSAAARIDVIEAPSRAEVLRLMSGALFLLHPSRFEGLPAVPAEAMAAGVPVVATDVGGVREVLGDPGGGLLIPAGDGDALTGAAKALISDDGFRAELSRRARAASRHLSWDRVADDHLEFLDALAGLRAGGGADKLPPSSQG